VECRRGSRGPVTCSRVAIPYATIRSHDMCGVGALDPWVPDTKNSSNPNLQSSRIRPFNLHSVHM
jgi:hypothetical protein